MKILVDEIATTTQSTASMLYVDGRPLCFVIEDGYNFIKIPEVSRIPGGTYQVHKRVLGRVFVSMHKRFQHEFVPHILNVPKFTAILFHPGNTPKDTAGCLLPVMSVQLDQHGHFEGWQSSKAYNLLYNLIRLAFERGEKVTVEVVRKPEENFDQFLIEGPTT